MILYSFKIIFRRGKFILYLILPLLAVFLGGASAYVNHETGSSVLTLLTSFFILMFYDLHTYGRNLFVKTENFLLNPLPVYKKFGSFVFFDMFGSRLFFFLISFIIFIAFSLFVYSALTHSITVIFLLSYFIYSVFMIIPHMLLPKSKALYHTLGLVVLLSFLIIDLARVEFDFPGFFNLHDYVFIFMLVILFAILYFASFLVFMWLYQKGKL